jgi:LL-diaminopimelate aminotransferase
LPPYLFAEIDRRKREALGRGVDLIDLGIGDPDIPTPPVIVEKLIESASKPVNHRYPNSSGMAEFRDAVANWYQRRFNVRLDAGKEVVSLIGSKEGIGNMAVAFVDPDVVLVPAPAIRLPHRRGIQRRIIIFCPEKTKPVSPGPGFNPGGGRQTGQAPVDQLSE